MEKVDIDLEWFGTRPREIDLTVWAHGDNIYKTYKLGFDSSKDFHKYAFDWTKNRVELYVDGEKLGEVTKKKYVPNKPQPVFCGVYQPSWQHKPYDDGVALFDYVKVEKK